MSEPRRLRDLAADAAYKIRLRARRPPDPAKWPPDGVDADGNRDWLRCSPAFLLRKLDEEVTELRAEVNRALDAPSVSALDDLRFEAADVAAVALMLAERCGAYDGRPVPPRVICLCGSTRFADTFVRAQLDETLAGHIVLTIGCPTQSDERLKTIVTEAVKIKLDELHKRKIDLADEVLVLNVGGYVGDSTRSEIAYACALGRPVRYLEPTGDGA